MLILDGTIPADVTAFLQRIYAETDLRDIITYSQWLSGHASNCAHPVPRGIVYMRISPTIANARIQKRADPAEASMTLEILETIYTQQENLFIERQGISQHLQNLPVLVLNGNIDFQTDFAQFYNHLFYIKRFYKDIQDREDLARGIYKEKPQRKCC